MHDYLNLLVAQETHHFNNASIKGRSPTTETQVLPQEKKTYPRIILMFGQCVGERVSLEVLLGYGFFISVKMPTFCLEQAKQAALC